MKTSTKTTKGSATPEEAHNKIDEAVAAGRITPEIREAQSRRYPWQQSQLETYEDTRWRKDATELLTHYLHWNPSKESLQMRLHKTVNSHAQLLEACKAVQPLVERYKQVRPIDYQMAMLLTVAQKKASAAIAQAEGKLP